jgi:hypothetical protein
MRIFKGLLHTKFQYSILSDASIVRTSEIHYVAMSGSKLKMRWEGCPLLTRCSYQV